MNVKDLCTLEILDEDSVLKTLKERYDLAIIYTWIGDILISINPYKELQVYSKKISQDYKNKYSYLTLPPHIYGLSSHIYQCLLLSNESQCFIVSGESGAGKTVAYKEITKHFLSLCKFEDRLLFDKICQVDVILEAFGNAETNLNKNASRFGKYLEIVFSHKGYVSGANITEYLLEKSRVVEQREDEQNYHVFYYMFSGKTDEELSKQLLESPSQHRYLKYGASFCNDLIKWSEHYASLIKAFTTVGFHLKDISSIFGVLSATLNLGDIKFVEDDKTGVHIENLHILDKVTLLLGLEADNLDLHLTSNISSASEEGISSFKTIEEAYANRDGLARHLYGRLFGWISSKINLLLLCAQPNKKKSEQLCAGFLDIFGFEDFQRNSYEQLCINVSNEQIQFHFAQHVFAWEQLEYQQEELDIPVMEYTSNKNLINLLLEKPHGLFALLEEESKCLQADDNTLVSSFNAHCSHHENYVASNAESPMFSVQHYARKVVYSAEGFLNKNNDKLPANVIDCLKGSKDELISTLFTSNLTRTGALSLRTGTGTENCCHGDLREKYERKQKQRTKVQHNCNTSKASHNLKTKSKKIRTNRKAKQPLTVGMQFRNSLVELMEKVMLCQAHFVRCIIPNKSKQADLFDDEIVSSQVKYTAIMDTIKIRQRGYPVRQLLKTFIQRYRFISYPLSTNIKDSVENCEKILKDCDVTSGWKIGKTKIFLQLDQVKRLTKELQKLVAKVIITQKMVRGHLARIDFDFLQTNRKQEERSLGNLLVSISSKSNKMFDNLVALNETDVKGHERLKEKEKKGKEENQFQKRKITETSSDPDSVATIDDRRGESSPNRKVPRSKPRGGTEPMMRTFTSTSMSAWCRVDCYERQYHIASFQMDQAVICVDGTHPVSDKNRIAFASLPARSDDSKVTKVKSCIGKGVQLHQDERENLWATRLGKNPIFVRGHTLCPELVKLNGKLTQGVPMKVLDAAAFKEYMRKECEASGVDDEVKDRIMSRLKVCMSFIKDTVVDEETPCWFEIWLVKVKEYVKRFLENYQKRREHEEKRKLSHLNTPTQTAETTAKPRQTTAPQMRRAKSGDQLRERRPRSHTALTATTNSAHSISKIPRPPSQTFNAPNMEKALNRLKTLEQEENLPRKIIQQDAFRREKSMDVRLESRLLMNRGHRGSTRGTEKKLLKLKKSSPQESPEQSLMRAVSSRYEVQDTNMDSISSSEQVPVTNTHIDDNTPNTVDNKRTSAYNAPKAGMSYRQVFGLQSSDYLFNVTPPNYTRHRRFSDSDTESLQNFVHRIIPQDDSRNKVLQNIQPKKWMKKVRKKSEEAPKKKLIAQLSNK